MTDNASQVIQKLGSSLLGLNLKIKDIEGGLGRVKVAAAGLGAVMGGAVVLSSMAKLVDHGKEFVHQQSLMAQAGISQAEIAQGTAAAWKTAGDVIGSSADKNIALVADLRNRLGSMKEAIAAMPAMAKLGVFLQNGTGQDQEKAGDTAARFLEQRGALVDPVTHQISESRLEQQSKLLEAIAIGTRFKVGPDQLLAFQSYARASGSTLTDQGLVNLAPVISASKSPSTVGTQLSSLDQQLLGGIMTSAGAHFLEGLKTKDGQSLMDPNKVHEGKGGHLTLDPSALIDGDLLRRDPVTWIHDYLGGALIQKGAVTADQQVAAVMQSHLRATVTGLMAEVLRSFPAFAKDATNITQSLPTDQYAVSQKTDPTARLAAFHTAWENLLTALGSPLVNDATGMLTNITAALNRLTAWASAHPKAVENIEMVTAALAGLAVVGGSLAIAGAALSPFITGLKMLSGVLGGAEMVSATAAATTLGAGAGVAGSLLGLAAGVVAFGAAAAGLAVLLKTVFGDTSSNPHPSTNAHGIGYSNRTPDHSVAPVPKPPPTQAWSDWLRDQWNASNKPQNGGNARGIGAHVQKQSFETPEDGGTTHMQPIHVSLELDGRVVARSVTHHQAREDRSGSQQGMNDPDFRAMPFPAGLRSA